MIYFSCLVDVSHEVKWANFLQVLQPGVWRRKDPHPAPKGEALQVSHLPQEALHGAGTVDPLHAGPQGNDRQGTENGESFSIPLTSLLSVLGLSTLNIIPSGSELPAQPKQHRDWDLRNGGDSSRGRQRARATKGRRQFSDRWVTWRLEIGDFKSHQYFHNLFLTTQTCRQTITFVPKREIANLWWFISCHVAIGCHLWQPPLLVEESGNACYDV